MGNSCCVSTNTLDNTRWAKSSHDEPIPQAAWVQPRRGARSRVVRARPKASGTVSRWADRHDVLAPCGSFDDVLSAARLDSDPILAALLTEVSIGDQLAGRVVLQALIGRMVRMAQRDPRAGIDDYLARLWCAINSYPLSRRPVRIAANLSMDTLKAVSREHRWLGRGDVTLWPSSESLEELLEPATS